MARVALNLHFLRPSVTGGGETYAVQLVRAIAASDTHSEYLIFCNRHGRSLDLPRQENFRVVMSPVGANVAPRYGWEQLAMPYRLHRAGIQLVHSMGYVVPLATRIPQVVTIPDANWTQPATMSASKARLLGFFVRRSARVAKAIITGTQVSARSLQAHLPRAHAPIYVMPWGADHLFAGSMTPPARAVRPPFVLALGGTHAHKNVDRLIVAFERVAAQVPHRLVIAGRMTGAARDALLNSSARDRIVSLGYVPEEQLRWLYSHATLFVFPSLYEGFGLPLLEAQSCGSPVAASAIAALTEIGSRSVEYFDADSVASIASTLCRLLADPARLSELSAASVRNAAIYTWARTARATLQVYATVLETAGSGSATPTA